MAGILEVFLPDQDVVVIVFLVRGAAPPLCLGLVLSDRLLPLLSLALRRSLLSRVNRHATAGVSVGVFFFRGGFERIEVVRLFLVLSSVLIKIIHHHNPVDLALHAREALLRSFFFVNGCVFVFGRIWSTARTIFSTYIMM